MTVLTAHFEDATQLEKVIAFFRRLNIAYEVKPSLQEHIISNFDEQDKDWEKLGLAQFASEGDWDAPENDHWDTY